METYLTIEDAYGYGISLQKARRLTDEEKPKYAEWFQRSGFIGLGDHISLPEVGWDDTPKRDSNGYFPGCSNRVWIITQKEWDAYVELNATREKDKADAKAAEEAAYEQKQAERRAEKAKRVSKLDAWGTTDKIITDEGGKAHLHTHTLTLNGKTYTFTERNVFDFGRVINPAYEIAPGHDSGICTQEGGKLWWMGFDKNSGWELIREMDPDEAYCYAIVRDFGSFAGHWTRM